MVLSAVFIASPAFILLAVAALALDIYCLVDVARRPDWQWQASGQSRTLWLVLTIVGVLVGRLVISIVYLVLPRPKLVRAEANGPTGGYGGPPGAYGGGYQPYGGYGTPGGYSPPPAPPTTVYTPPAGGYTPPAQPPAAPPPASPPPGWYPDPAGSGQPRYWNGQAWSEHSG